LCILSLALDGYTGPAQERLNKTYPQLSMATMMFYLNAWAILLVAVALMFTGQMMPGLQFCMDNPSILSEAALFSLCASSGQALILYTLLQFNSLVVVTVTTTRKFFTILLSVVLYGHALAGPQWAGVALVFAGLSLDIYAKYADRGKHGHKHAGKGQDAEKTTNHAATPIPAHSVAAAAPAAVAAPAASSGKKKKPSRKAD
jgi:UDP-galactose transporter B1